MRNVLHFLISVALAASGGQSGWKRLEFVALRESGVSRTAPCPVRDKKTNSVRISLPPPPPSLESNFSVVSSSPSESSTVSMPALKAWLQEETPVPTTALYRYRRFGTKPVDDALRAELQAFAREAHRDALRRLEAMLRPAMEPFPGAAGWESDRSTGYPYELHEITLQGYFGELLAAGLAQVAAPFEEDGWEVPAFRWRVNVFDLFRALERFRMERTEIPAIFGAHGDDCTAFHLSEADGEIHAYLVCECKCTLTHRAELIAKAHEQLKSEPTAMDIPQLLTVLEDAPSGVRERWSAALWRMYFRPGSVPRRHLVLYIYGQRPIKKEGWLSADKPHDDYKSSEPLEAIELHVDGLADLIADVYAEEPAWK